MSRSFFRALEGVTIVIREDIDTRTIRHQRHADAICLQEIGERQRPQVESLWNAK